MEVSFSIEGEFITNLARERFYVNHNLKAAVELVQSATMTDQLSESEHLALCLEIIAGSKNIVGTYPGDDYGLEKTDKSTDEAISQLLKKIDNTYAEFLNAKTELQEMQQKISFLAENMSETKIKQINTEYHTIYGKYLFTDYPANAGKVFGSNMLDSFLSRAKDNKEHTYADYGWLEPDGTYHEVDWGEHSKWAAEYCTEHYPHKKYADMYWKDEYKTIPCYGGDLLVYKLHWVLLDSPSQGLAIPKYDIVTGLTKAQKEFLYDYYIERGRNKEANEIWKDSE